MKKDRFTGPRPVGTKKVRFLVDPATGTKFAVVPASRLDATDGYFAWNHSGEYIGWCSWPWRGADKAQEISKEGFLLPIKKPQPPKP